MDCILFLVNVMLDVRILRVIFKINSLICYSRISKLGVLVMMKMMLRIMFCKKYLYLMIKVNCLIVIL